MTEMMVQEPITDEIKQEWVSCLEAMRDAQKIYDMLGSDNPMVLGEEERYDRLVADYNRIKAIVDSGVLERPATEDERRYSERLQAAEEIMNRLSKMLER